MEKIRNDTNYNFITHLSCFKKYIIYVDGKYKPDFNNVDDHLGDSKLNIKFKDVIPVAKGDTISKTIALASIIAKETRDSIMRHYSQIYPKYSFNIS